VKSETDNLKSKIEIPVETIQIRFATPDDVPAIVNLVNHFASDGTVLPRTSRSVYEHLDQWFVAEAGGEILGCVSLMPYTSGLVEVRSLAVQQRYQGLGIGRRLMNALLAEARRRQIPRLFALTRIIPFFIRFGFTVSERERFPEKVWRDCQQCPLMHNCDETAMVLDLSRE